MERVDLLGGRATLYLGDCLTLMPMIGQVDAVVTDPPFGIDYRSGHRTDALWSEDRIRHDETTAVRDAALSMLVGVPALVFGSWKAPRPTNTRMVLTWDKGPALGMGALDLPWKPSSEEIYVIGKGFIGTRDEGAVIYCPPVQSMAKNGRVHPNQKPVQLLERLIKKVPEGVLLDPFMGSGSTGVAAIKSGRRFIGIEIDPRYFEIAKRRISELANQADLFAAPAPAAAVQEDLL